MRLLLALILAAAPLAPLSLRAEGSGIAAMPSLKLLRGARGAGLGGAQLALSDDAGALLANPAGLVELRNVQLSASHLEWLDGVRDDTLQMGLPLYGLGAWGVGASLLYAQDEGRDNWGNPTGGFSYYDFSAQVTLALQLGSEASGGLTYRILNQSSDTRFNMGSGFDFGLRYKGFFKRSLVLALGSFNMGTPLALGANFAPLPWTLKSGAAWMVTRDLSLECDYEYEPLEFVNRVRMGSEYAVAVGDSGRAALRAGYVLGPGNAAGSLAGLSAGLGLGFKGLSLDYAYAPIGDLGVSHRASMTYEFGRH